MPYVSSSSDSEICESNTPLPIGAPVDDHKKTGKRCRTYTDSEEDRGQQERRPKKSSKRTHVTTRFNSRDRHDVRVDREVLKEVRQS